MRYLVLLVLIFLTGCFPRPGEPGYAEYQNQLNLLGQMNANQYQAQRNYFQPIPINNRPRSCTSQVVGSNVFTNCY